MIANIATKRMTPRSAKRTELEIICQFIGLLFVIHSSGWAQRSKWRADGVPKTPSARIRQPEVNRRKEAESQVNGMPRHSFLRGEITFAPTRLFTTNAAPQNHDWIKHHKE